MIRTVLFPPSAAFFAQPALLLGALLFLPIEFSPAQGQEPPTQAATAAADFDQIVQSYASAQEAWRKQYSAASESEQKKLMKDRPTANSYLPRMWKVAEFHASAPAGVQGLIWIAQQTYSGPDHEKAMDLLRSHHLMSEEIGSVCRNLAGMDGAKGIDCLRRIIKDNPHPPAQAQARFFLAGTLKNESPAEAEKLFEELEQSYASQKIYGRSAAEVAKGELFEMRNLAIGKVAPDIEGKDVDGKSFKLSDYRGKVVVIDFWGDW